MESMQAFLCTEMLYDRIIFSERRSERKSPQLLVFIATKRFSRIDHTNAADEPLQVLVQEVKDNTKCLWSILVEVDVVARFGDEMLDEALRILVVRVGRFVVDSWTVAVANNVISFCSNGL